MGTGSTASGRVNMRRVLAIASCVLGVALILLAFRVGTQSSKKTPQVEGEASGAEPTRKKPARVWNIALGNVVVVAPELGLSLKPAKDPAPEQSKVVARIESQLQSLRELYRHESEKNPGLMGSMTLQFMVEPSGEVTKVKEVSSRLSNSDFKKAVISAVSQWSFREVVANGATIHCPLLFVREGMDITTLVQWEKSFGQNGDGGTGAYGHTHAAPVKESKITENNRQSESATKTKITGAEKASRVSAAKPSAIHQLMFATSLRKQPNFSSPAVTRLAVGTKVSLIDTRGDWLEVREEGTRQSGFIRREFISSPTSAHKP
ncbi:MAG: AgmX/PglI C-terminal domain-containing protein [Deltaproteobacteria bacterium]|nr:AgmX/PglI C-terminal domain-containing protein [Deltaproteobacteria bacterium]MBI2231579.1 AgmX/PglI C-terminal domain-containing protein [Deltaproteobacteria bacterium]